LKLISNLFYLRNLGKPADAEFGRWLLAVETSFRACSRSEKLMQASLSSRLIAALAIGL
jgi:hypothetical protein